MNISFVPCVGGFKKVNSCTRDFCASPHHHCIVWNYSSKVYRLRSISWPQSVKARNVSGKMFTNGFDSCPRYQVSHLFSPFCCPFIVKNEPSFTVKSFFCPLISKKYSNFFVLMIHKITHVPRVLERLYWVILMLKNCRRLWLGRLGSKVVFRNKIFFAQPADLTQVGYV